MVGVREVDTIGGRGGMVAVVGGSETPVWLDCSDGGAMATAAAPGSSGCTGIPAAGVSGRPLVVALLAGVAIGADVAAISRTTPVARSASRRLSSSETLSVGDVRDAFLAVVLVFGGLGCTFGGD
jgi:hypothetical protein